MLHVSYTLLLIISHIEKCGISVNVCVILYMIELRYVYMYARVVPTLTVTTTVDDDDNVDDCLDRHSFESG